MTMLGHRDGRWEVSGSVPSTLLGCPLCPHSVALVSFEPQTEINTKVFGSFKTFAVFRMQSVLLGISPPSEV